MEKSNAYRFVDGLFRRPGELLHKEFASTCLAVLCCDHLWWEALLARLNRDTCYHSFVTMLQMCRNLVVIGYSPLFGFPVGTGLPVRGLPAQVECFHPTVASSVAHRLSIINALTRITRVMDGCNSMEVVCAQRARPRQLPRLLRSLLSKPISHA